MAGIIRQNVGEGVSPDAGDAVLDQPGDLLGTQAVLLRTSCGAGLTPLKIRLLVLIPLPAIYIQHPFSCDRQDALAMASVCVCWQVIVFYMAKPNV